MSRKEKRDLAASVLARLLARSKSTGEEYQTLVTSYAYERFLYRLGTSPVRDRFILKGAMLLRVWSENPYRATRDLDLLRRGSGDADAIRADVRTVCEAPAQPDGIEFDVAAMQLEPIRSEDEYVGTRLSLPMSCGTFRTKLQIDLGLGDAVYPPPTPHRYPPLLDAPAPEILAYAAESVIAEKLQAMLVLADRNSRIKDFFDIRFLAESFSFERATLVEAVRRTLGRRHTPLPQDEPFGLTSDYWNNPSRTAQVRGFARRAGLAIPTSPETTILPVLRAFLLPVLEDVREGREGRGTWPPGGPWEAGG